MPFPVTDVIIAEAIMPIFRVRCVSCGHVFDKLTGFSRLGEIVCEKCGGKVERVYNGVAVFGGKSANGGTCSCGGNCACCSGCQK